MIFLLPVLLSLQALGPTGVDQPSRFAAFVQELGGRLRGVWNHRGGVRRLRVMGSMARGAKHRRFALQSKIRKTETLPLLATACAAPVTRQSLHRHPASRSFDSRPVALPSYREYSYTSSAGWRPEPNPFDASGCSWYESGVIRR